MYLLNRISLRCIFGPCRITVKTFSLRHLRVCTRSVTYGNAESVAKLCHQSRIGPIKGSRRLVLMHLLMAVTMSWHFCFYAVYISLLFERLTMKTAPMNSFLRMLCGLLLLRHNLVLAEDDPALTSMLLCQRKIRRRHRPLRAEGAPSAISLLKRDTLTTGNER